jgi:hypothetical protein
MFNLKPIQFKAYLKATSSFLLLKAYSESHFATLRFYVYIPTSLLLPFFPPDPPILFPRPIATTLSSLLALHTPLFTSPDERPHTIRCDTISQDQVRKCTTMICVEFQMCDVYSCSFLSDAQSCDKVQLIWVRKKTRFHKSSV